MSHTAYSQVALTYLRRLFSPFWVGLVIVAALVMIFLPILGSQSSDQLLRRNCGGLMIFFFQGFTMLCALLSIHIKDQFADSRAHLLPEFRKTHIALAGTAVFVVAVLLPAAASACLRLHSIGLVAFLVFWFGLIGWTTLSQKTWQMFAVVVVFFAGLFWGGNFRRFGVLDNSSCKHSGCWQSGWP